MKQAIFVRFAVVVSVLTVGAVSIAGCSEEVTAILDTDSHFALYGVISPNLDSQSVRVYPVEGILAPLPPELLDAVFTSTDLHSGEVRTWRDSIVTDTLGQFGHVFWSAFRAEFGHTYRIEVTRPSDGNASSVEVAVPPVVDVDLGEPQTPGPIIQPIRVRGGAPRLLHTYVEYRVQPVIEESSGRIIRIQRNFNVAVPQAGRERKTGNDWILDVNLSQDYERVRNEVGAAAANDIPSTSGTLHILMQDMSFKVMIATEDWNPPGGIFNPEELVNPETLSNVENGTGFVGAGYSTIHSVLPSPDIYREAGFWSEEDLATALLLAGI